MLQLLQQITVRAHWHTLCKTTLIIATTHLCLSRRASYLKHLSRTYGLDNLSSMKITRFGTNYPLRTEDTTPSKPGYGSQVDARLSAGIVQQILVFSQILHSKPL